VLLLEVAGKRLPGRPFQAAACATAPLLLVADQTTAMSTLATFWPDST